MDNMDGGVGVGVRGGVRVRVRVWFGWCTVLREILQRHILRNLLPPHL